MNHSIVYKLFALYFPDYAGDKDVYKRQALKIANVLNG